MRVNVKETYKIEEEHNDLMDMGNGQRGRFNAALTCLNGTVMYV